MLSSPWLKRAPGEGEVVEGEGWGLGGVLAVLGVWKGCLALLFLFSGMC